jgi:hypothetical protein
MIIMAFKAHLCVVRSAVFSTLFLLVTGSAVAQEILVGSDANISLGSGSLDFGCGNLSVAGTFSVNAGSAFGIRDAVISTGRVDGGSGSLSLSGNWENLGQFAAQSGSVQVVDGCAVSSSVFTGDTTFGYLSLETNTGKEAIFTSGSTQTVTRGLSLTGMEGNRLAIRASQAGADAAITLAAGASQLISWVDVQDINSGGGQVLAPGSPMSFLSLDSGNNLNWFIESISAIPVDTLPFPVIGLLAVLLLLVARKMLRQTTT